MLRAVCGPEEVSEKEGGGDMEDRREESQSKDINTCAICQIRPYQLTPGELLMKPHYPHRHMVYDSLKKKNKNTKQKTLP